MNSHSFLQPKNALQRAEELKNVGQKAEAFEVLNKTVQDRKFRYLQWDSAAQQEVVTQYVALAVELDTIKQTREGLLQYRNYCQHSMSQLAPLEKVLLHFRDCAENKLSAIEANEEAKNATAVVTTEVDLAESLITGSLNPGSYSDFAKQHRDAQRLVLDTYKTIVDLIKTTPRLQRVYHETIHRAYDFCLKYKLRNDFRRLAELVRNHYNTIMRQRSKQESDLAAKEEVEDLKRPELHIETRLSQLENAAALELWKEAMQTIEDLYGLGIIDLASKRVVVKSKSASAVQLRQLLLMSLASYYAKLADVFGRSGYKNLHALALLKWLVHTKQHNRALSADDYSALASITVLAVLSVPYSQFDSKERHHGSNLPGTAIGAGHTGNNSRFDEEKRLASLLGQPTIPTRENLISMIKDRWILNSAFPCVKHFFNLVEAKDATFLPLSIVENVKEPLAKIEEFLQKAAASNMSSEKPALPVVSTAITSLTTTLQVTALSTAPAESTETIPMVTPSTLMEDSTESAGGSGLSSTMSPAGALARRYGKEYIESLREMVFRRLVLKLSSVYSTVSIDFFRTKICPESFMPWTHVEYCLVKLGSECRDLNLRLDYSTRALRLRSESTSKSPVLIQTSARLAQLSSGLMTLLSKAAVRSSLSLIQGAPSAQSVCLSIRKRVPLEEAASASRLELLEKRRVELESFKKRRDENLEELAKERAQKELDLELKRVKRLAEEKALNKKREEAESARLECARQLLIRMKTVATQVGATPQTFTLGGSPLAVYTPEAFLSRKITYKDFELSLEDYIAKVRQEAIRQKRAEHKRLDHYARALRMEEAACLDEYVAEVVAEDEKLFKAATEAREKARAAAMADIMKRRSLIEPIKDKIEKWVAKQLQNIQTYQTPASLIEEQGGIEPESAVSSSTHVAA